MKKFVAITVVFALLVGSAFAVDLSGTVFGNVKLLDGKTGKWYDDPDNPPDVGGITQDGKKAKLGVDGGMARLRVDGSGESEDGKFGGFIRIGDGNPLDNIWGNAWWKPIDQVKLIIGGNPDGFYGKDGNARWMFYAMDGDGGVANPNNAWGGGGMYGLAPGTNFGTAFYEGNGGDALRLEIKPIDLLGINLEIPFTTRDAKAAYQNFLAQIDLSLGFGNIALTYDNNVLWSGANGSRVREGANKLWLYFGLTAIENVSIDVGFGYSLPTTVKNEFNIGSPTMAYNTTRKYNDAMGIGLAFKYGGEKFGIKSRVLATMAGKNTYENSGIAGGTGMNAAYKETDKNGFELLFDVLPYFAINDNFKVCLSAGIGFAGKGTDEKYGPVDPTNLLLGYAVKSTDIDGGFGWHINPYIQIGGDWGPKFLAGVQLMQTPDLDHSGIAKTANTGIETKGSKYLQWSVPISVMVSF